MKITKNAMLSLFLTAALLLAGCASKDSGVKWYDAPMGDGESADAKDGSAAGLDDAAAPSEDANAADGLQQESQIPAGQLTCGVWSDRDNFDFWKNVINQNDFYTVAERWGIKATNRYGVTVTDGAGNPVYRAAVKLSAADGSTLFTASTDVYGRAELYWGHRGEGAAPAKITVADPSGAVTEITDLTSTDVSVTVGSGATPSGLELLFTVDTTGSMGDELNYLSAELSDVIGRVESATGMHVSTSVNFYRDTEDEYLVRSFPFGSAADAIGQISAQSANGGGDYPEAVHSALADAITGHQWSENSVKVCVLVLDAPPHEQDDVIASLHDTVQAAAAQGIRIVPVMCSSGNDTASLLCRAFALLTGGEYLFLTDDSGIGGEHHVPMVGEYSVECLNDALIRVIAGHCGTKIDIRPVKGGEQE